jgi:hypothetical protein
MLQKCSWKVAVIILLGLLAGGCLMAVGAMVGVGAYQWAEGTMTKDYPRTMEPTWHACVAACKTMGLTIKRESYSPTHSKITAATGDGTTVDVELIARPNNITTVKVRFGFMGNKDQSAYFHRNVMKNLGIE